MAMTLTNDDLQAIKGLFDDRFDRIETDISDLKTDVSGLKEDVSNLKVSVSGLESDVSSLKSEMQEVKGRVTRIEVVQLENYLIPKVEEIASYQKSVYERYSKGADRFDEKISLIDTINTTVKDHSRRIQDLERKKA